MKIHAAVAFGAGEPFRIEECELSAPGPGEMLVELLACGICHTDLAAKDHGMGTPLPAVLGHEGTGIVRELGEGVSGFAAGDRVLMSFGACGSCPSCSNRKPSYCQHVFTFNLLGTRVDGSSPVSLRGQSLTGHFFAQSSFASHAVVSVTNAVRLDDDLPPELMAPLACGVQTGMGTVVNVLQAGPQDSVAVFGCGTVGLSAVIAARIRGCRRIIAVDLNEARLTLARELGATDTINPAGQDLAAALAALGGASRAFDTTGVTAVIETAFNSLHPLGMLVCAGVSPHGSKITLDPVALMPTGRMIRGTIEGDAVPREFIPQMIGWYREGLLPLEKLVQTYPFAAINEAAADMDAGRVVKPVLLM